MKGSVGMGFGLAAGALLWVATSSGQGETPISGWEVVQMTGFNTRGINVPCPMDKRVLGGGCWVYGSNASGGSVALEVSAPTDGVGWTCMYEAPTSELAGFAVCATVDAPKLPSLAVAPRGAE